MADRKGVCRLYAKNQRCKYGNNCKFEHDRGGNAAQGGSRSSQSSRPPSIPNTPPRTPGPNPPVGNASPVPGRATGVPNQTCNWFWTTGSCARSFDCSFKHIRGPVAAAGTTSAEETIDHESSLDFFSIEGLAVNSGAAARSERHALNPNESHNHLKPFLRDNYHFEGASRIQGFVRILGSINDRNKTWDSDKSQAFLEMLVNGNGIIRIGDVLRFEPVSHHIGYGAGALSFQSGYFPVLEYFASDLVLKSTLHRNINHLYNVFEQNYEKVHVTLSTSVGGMIAAKTWKDTTLNLPEFLQVDLDGIIVFKALTTIYLQYFGRFKDAIKNHPEIADFVQSLDNWFHIWSSDVGANPPRFADSITMIEPSSRRLIVNQLREELNRLVTIVLRESVHAAKLKRPIVPQAMTVHQRRQARIMQLGQSYDPPGSLREGGSRHDNDFENIADIRIAPTHGELLCSLAPYLPVVLADAPHHLPENSMERHLDIQFRLLREELISPLRSSINAIHDDLTEAWQRTQNSRRAITKLEDLLKKRGGTYKSTGFDSVFFSVYTGVQFAPVKAERRNLTVGLLLDTPATGAARDKDAKKRALFWEHSRKLQSGSIVALMLVSRGTLKIFLGVTSSMNKDIAESSKASKDTIQVQISFFDPEVELRALQRDQISDGLSSYAFLVDNSVMYEASRPFLERMQTIEPTEIPFARYIAHRGDLREVQTRPPLYATAPQFKFKLQCLAKDSRQVIRDLDISQPNAVATARQQLMQSSILDPSQVEAVVNTLTHEVSLIQGPPGTGKSFTGKEILRVLFASGVKPIILIAYTNHALDHMLTSVLDSKITEKIVRLGSRSSDERIAEYTLDKLEKVAGRSNIDRSIGRQYGVMKRLEEEMSKVMTSMQLSAVSWDEIKQYLEIHYPDHARYFEVPPFWVKTLADHLWQDEDENGEWKTTGKKKPNSQASHTLYAFWKEGKDLEFIARPSSGELDIHVRDFFTQLGFPSVPDERSTDRATDVLLDTSLIWSMSAQERYRLAEQWEQDIRVIAYTSNLDRYKDLRASYKQACDDYNDIKDETRRRLLSSIDLIGCTTTGAAKLTSLLSSIRPRVLLVEEAGQVLEAHVLTSLVPSVHHLICIGDPQQLRPTLATFSLSMDSERGRELFKLDRSLMERLSDAGLPMTQINVQRRMRPLISHFIRRILYPKLQDHDVVNHYPEVKGMQKDVYFLNHKNAENGSDDSVSKVNTYEVGMIKDLVLYFLRQDEYSGAGDIAVLCAYLGQLQKVRAALRDLKIAVAVDERDEKELERQGIDDDAMFEQVVVAKHIRLGTVDIFQGQEAKIVIVSLVRNTGTFETNSASIGFLKSSNRINVALSRAKHGLYILGNASNLRRNETWSTIVDDLEARDQIGPALPIVCPRHPNEVRLISEPGELDRHAPYGGCLEPCGSQLPCGHTCPSVCHSASDNHRSMRCKERCTRTPCLRRHPCTRECSDDCGDCTFPMYNVRLPCGHVAKTVECYMLEKLDKFKCPESVQKRLPTCEHSAKVPCHKDPSSVQCKEICGGILDCCSKTCKSHCSACQEPTRGKISKTMIKRTKHKTHLCERSLYCQHQCGLTCSKEHKCNPTCGRECRQQCVHHKCAKPCSVPCAPCMEQCSWTCPHYTCPVSCGSICTRLPCDIPCPNMLDCGHPCPSVCGEPCKQQLCPVCLPSEKRQDIVDMIMQRQLDDIDLSSTDMSDRLITLACKHIFTVETLDGHCGMGNFYEVDPLTGGFLATKAPPTEYQTPVTCPTCRGPITALRYGRVTKRATLDILEQNVASTMSHSLEALNPQIDKVTAALEGYQEAAKTIASDAENTKDVSHSRDAAATGKITEPLPRNFLDLNAMHSIHGFSSVEARAWHNIVKEAVNVYGKAQVIATTRGAHAQAYEGAITTLYHLELEAIAGDPERSTTEAPEPLALEAVNTKIGQPPHRADCRFQIEAYIRTLELRFILAQVGFTRIEGLSVTATEENGVRHRSLWTGFVEFIYDSCVADAGKAFSMAEKSSASRQAARCSVYILRSLFEQFRFQVMKTRDQLLKPDNPNFIADREDLAGKVKAKKTEYKNTLKEYEERYIRSCPVQSMADMIDEWTWFRENCSSKVDRFMNDLDALEDFVRRGGGYQPLSMQEREEIVKAFDFGYTGHFYNCPNGHPFVITECGGAMQEARCPECRLPIGGGDHRLLGSNTQATEFEEILRARGARQGYF